MSKDSRKKARRDRFYPKERRTHDKQTYIERRNALYDIVCEKFNVHIHTRRIPRYGLRAILVVKISGLHRDNETRVSKDEALEILRMFQAEFPEMGRVIYEMRE